MKTKISIALFLAVSLAGSTANADGEAIKKGMVCLDVKPTKVELGVKGDYKVTEGMSVKTMGGLLNRQDSALSGCMVPELEPAQCVVLFYPKAALDKLGNSNDWQVQCVLADAHDKGMIPNDFAPYTVSTVDNKDMILKCGHDQGDKVGCLDGSHSMRGDEFQKLLKEKGETMLSVCAHRASNTDPKEYQDAKYICQYFNKTAKKVLFGFEYMRELRK